MHPINKIRDIDAERLSALMGSTVDELQLEQIGRHVGYMSDVFRIKLVGSDLPASIILKMSAQDPSRLALAERFQSYVKESHFYSQIADRVGLEIPWLVA